MKPNKALNEKMLALGYLDVSTAADRVGISTTTLYRAISADKVVSTKVNKRQFVLITSLLDFVGEGGRAVYEATANAPAKPQAAEG